MQLSGLISECGFDQKALFRTVGEWLLVKAKRKLPENDSLQELTDDFITFFSKKPADLRADIDTRETGGNHLCDILSPAVAEEDCLFFIFFLFLVQMLFISLSFVLLNRALLTLFRLPC
jgi:hypothetical protein